MLRECHVYKPPTSVVQSTLKWAFADLEEAAMRQTAFSLLKVLRHLHHVRNMRICCVFVIFMTAKSSSSTLAVLDSFKKNASRNWHSQKALRLRRSVSSAGNTRGN